MGATRSDIDLVYLVSLGDDESSNVLSFNAINKAAERISGGIVRTPLCIAKISKSMDYDIYLKCENLQYTGSCAERGILNFMMAAGADIKSRGVVVASQGALALAAAYHGHCLGIPVTVVMPERASPSLAYRCSDLGAKVVVCGDSLEQAVTYANKLYKETEQFYVSSDDLLVIAGLGTVGLEVIAQLPETEALLVPVAAGGLLAGTLVAAKMLKCSCLVYGVECSRVPTMLRALQVGRPVEVPTAPTLAEGLDAPCAGPNAFATIKGRLDRMLVVDEAWVARAVLALVERERLVASGGGVVALAALMQGLAPELRGKRVVCVISSGNIESGQLSRAIQRGLGAESRLVRFAVPVPDTCFGLKDLATAIANQQAILKSLTTEQVWVTNDVNVIWANVVVETVNEEHTTALKDYIRNLYPCVRFVLYDLEDKH
ncbi:hypothetical protein EVAR_65874_1 [Eumeta japonica]|uniref:L-serine deaminase n=1 Tax=Eumeta variegata TaxID=151549 RepID=A0A4C1ZDH6_EUMVA|nr:hypothetical protein EVAR_65874_1 [Eumeta japonica]